MKGYGIGRESLGEEGRELWRGEKKGVAETRGEESCREERKGELQRGEERIEEERKGKEENCTEERKEKE